MPSKSVIQTEFNFTLPEILDVKLLTVDELYSNIDKLSAVDMKENPKIERKPAGIHQKALGDYFSAFANTPPDGGIVLIGVEDDGTISGCKRSTTEHLNDLQRAGDIFCPDARYECREIQVINRANEPDIIIALRIKYRPDRVVELTDRTAWMRRGASKKKLDDDEKRELKDAKGQVDVELESVPLKFPDDFRLDLVRPFVEAVRTQRRWQSEMPIDEVLTLSPHYSSHARDSLADVA